MRFRLNHRVNRLPAKTLATITPADIFDLLLVELRKALPPDQVVAVEGYFQQARGSICATIAQALTAERERRAAVRLRDEKPVLIMQCGGKKSAVAVPVRELYRGKSSQWDRYRKDLQELGYPDKHPYVDAYVLSAALGVLPEDRAVCPYNLVLKGDSYKKRATGDQKVVKEGGKEIPFRRVSELVRKMKTDPDQQRILGALKGRTVYFSGQQEGEPYHEALSAAGRHYGFVVSFLPEYEKRRTAQQEAGKKLGGSLHRDAVKEFLQRLRREAPREIAAPITTPAWIAPRLTQAPTAIEVFSGGGLFSLAADIEGVEVHVHCEIDSHAVKTVQHNIDRKAVECDITRFKPSKAKGCLDIFMGGPPCQPWSRARAVQGGAIGADDPRNLWMETTRLIEQLRPRIVMLENVKGILAKKHLEALGRPGKSGEYPLGWWADAESLGYEGVIWDINAASYGTPQNRERVWFVLWPKGAPWGAKLRQPPPATHYDPRREPVNGLLPWVPAKDRFAEGCCQGYGLTTCLNLGNYRRKCSTCINGSNFEIAPNEDRGGAQLTETQRASYFAKLKKKGEVSERRRIQAHPPTDVGGVAYKPPSELGRKIVGQYLVPAVTKHMRKGVAPTRVATMEQSMQIDLSCPVDVDAVLLRELTVREAAKAQDVPQWYEFKGPRGAQYAQIGNGIAVNMGRAVVRHALDALGYGEPGGDTIAAEQKRMHEGGLWPFGDQTEMCVDVADISEDFVDIATGFPTGPVDRKGKEEARILTPGGDPDRERKVAEELLKVVNSLGSDPDRILPGWTEGFMDPDGNSAEAPYLPVDDIADTIQRYTDYAYGLPGEDDLLTALEKAPHWKRQYPGSDRVWEIVGYEYPDAPAIAATIPPYDFGEDEDSDEDGAEEGDDSFFVATGVKTYAETGLGSRIGKVGRYWYPIDNTGYPDDADAPIYPVNLGESGTHFLTWQDGGGDQPGKVWYAWDGGLMMPKDAPFIETKKDLIQHIRARSAPRAPTPAAPRAPTPAAAAPTPETGLFEAAQKKKKEGDLFDVYGEKGAPKPGEKGFRPAPKPSNPNAWGGQDPYALATKLIRNAQFYMNEPETLWAYQVAHPDIYSEVDPYDLEDTLPDLLAVPGLGGGGKPLSDEDRDLIAITAMDLAMEADPVRFSGMVGNVIGERKSRRGSPPVPIPSKRVDGREIPEWAADAILGDKLASVTPGYSMKTRLVNVSKEEAEAFIKKHHSALPYLNPRGLMYALGLKKGNRLVAVATAGTPTGKWKRVDPHRVVELTRVASDGSTANAASQLVARLIKIVKSGDANRGDSRLPGFFVTYQLGSEKGTTYSALSSLGLRPVAYRQGQKAGGARAKAGPESLADVDKVRWECCVSPPAAPANWKVLEPEYQAREREKATQKVAARAGEAPRGQTGLFGAAPEPTPVEVLSFSSGANEAGQIRGLTEIGKPPGVAVKGYAKGRGWYVLCREGCVRELISAVRKGLPIFMDSGAFGEIDLKGEAGPTVRLEITPEDWRERLEIYGAVIEAVGPEQRHLINVVAPDRVADQRVTVERLRRYRKQIHRMLDAGVRVLVPMQPGSATPTQFYQCVVNVLRRRDFIPSIPMPAWRKIYGKGKPGKEARKRALKAFLGSVKPPEIHLLGFSPTSTDRAEIAQAIRESGVPVKVQADATTWIGGRMGVGRGKGVGGADKPTTIAQDKAKASLQARNWPGTAESVWKDVQGGKVDYTDVMQFPSEWLAPGQITNISESENFSDEVKAAIVEDIDSALQRGVSGGAFDEEGVNLYVILESALDRAWGELDEVLSRGQQGKREAIGEVFGDQPEGRPVEGEMVFRLNRGKR